MASNSAQVDISKGEKELGVFIQCCQNYHEIVHQMFAGWRMKTDWCLGPVYDTPPLSVVCCNSVTCVTTVTSVTNITAVSRGSHACSVTFRVGLPWRKRRASLLQFLEQINSEFTLSTLICLLLAFPVNWREIFFCVYLYIYTYFEWWTWQLRRVLVAANIKLA